MQAKAIATQPLTEAVVLVTTFALQLFGPRGQLKGLVLGKARSLRGAPVVQRVRPGVVGSVKARPFNSAVI